MRVPRAVDEVLGAVADDVDRLGARIHEACAGEFGVEGAGVRRERARPARCGYAVGMARAIAAIAIAIAA